MEHAFNVELATKYDIDTALFLHHLKHWIFKNLANKKHIHDGLCWSYDTLEALADTFPYWSKRQIERVINNCVKRGLVVKGNYNSTAYDRTCWYALTPQAYWYFPELAAPKYLKLLYSSISPNGEMEFPEWGNQFPQTVTPIPDTIPDTKTYTPIIPKGMDAFEEFWKLYPKHKAQSICRTKWKAKKLDLIAPQIMDKLKQQIENDDEWLRGFIPNPSTYINQQRWNDDICKPRPDSPSVAPKKETPLAPIVVYSSFTAELKLMKKFKEIPEETPIPTFEQWTFQGITSDARTYVRGLK